MRATNLGDTSSEAPYPTSLRIRKQTAIWAHESGALQMQADLPCTIAQHQQYDVVKPIEVHPQPLVSVK